LYEFYKNWPIGLLVFRMEGHTNMHTLYMTQHNAVTLALLHSIQIAPHCISHHISLYHCSTPLHTTSCNTLVHHTTYCTTPHCTAYR